MPSRRGSSGTDSGPFSVHTAYFESSVAYIVTPAYSPFAFRA
jgi:hypothetical protein